MTGEISLHGRVMPIGGLREKAMAAYCSGIRTVLIPQENVPNLDEVETVVKENVRFLPMRDIDDVLDAALTKAPKPTRQKPVMPLAEKNVSTEAYAQ